MFTAMFQILIGCKTGFVGSLRVPHTPWAGPERRPTTQRTELFLMALSLGLRRGQLHMSGLVSAEVLEHKTQVMRLFNGDLNC